MPDPQPEQLPPIRHPARFVPVTALATGDVGAPALPVGAANPLPCREQPYVAVRELAPDAAVTPGIALLVDCSAGGAASLVLASGTVLTLTFSPGITLLPLAVSLLSSTGLTAVLDAWVLD